MQLAKDNRQFAVTMWVGEEALAAFLMLNSNDPYTFIGFTAMETLRLGGHFKRFSKVVDKKWIIESSPPPEKAPEPVKVKEVEQFPLAYA
jgi:hypothetical protein